MTKFIKPGVLYGNIKQKMRSFDLIMFRGEGLISNLIRALEKKGNKIPESGDFSHAGIILRYDMLKYVYPDNPNINEDSVYIWESTSNGKLGSDVLNIEGENFIGVQVRNLDRLIVNYDSGNKTAIAFGALKKNPIDKMTPENLKLLFVETFNKYNKASYDWNACSLCGSVNKKYRACRDISEKIFNTDSWLFCSEFVACVYRDLGVYPATINPKNVVPSDIAYYLSDVDKETTDIVNRLTYITTDKHYQKGVSDIEYTVNDHKFIKTAMDVIVKAVDQTIENKVAYVGNQAKQVIKEKIGEDNLNTIKEVVETVVSAAVEKEPVGTSSTTSSTAAPN